MDRTPVDAPSAAESAELPPEEAPSRPVSFDPSSVKPVRRRRVWPWVLVGILLLCGVAAALSWPIKVPYYAFSPGPVEDVSDFITVEEPVGDPSEGQLMFLTVSIRETNLLGYIGAWFADDVDLAPRENIRPAGVSPEQVREQNLDMMETSKDFATFVALDRLGHEPQLVGTGARVAEVVEGSAADGNLALDDVITAVDGEPVQFSNDAVQLVSGHAPGDTVEVTVERTGEDGEAETVVVPLTLTPFRFVQDDGTVEEDLDRGMVGVLLTNDEVFVDFPIPINIDSRNIGGPSAGLMFTLEIYDQLSEGDLTAGHRIAGTGSIDIDGTVGAIGGIRQKVFGAIAVGADIILVPAGNYEAAVSAAGDDIEVVRVENVDDALAFLDELEQESA